MQKQSLIVGLGKTGISCAHYLEKRNLPFAFYDTREALANLDAIKMEFPTHPIHLGRHDAIDLNHIEQIIKSPGVSPEHPLLQLALEKNIAVIGDIELLAREVNAPVISITGTNGKTTVTELVGEMARCAGIKTAVGGNIGTPVLELLDDDNDYDLWVLELSSFQLETTHSLKPSVATILNVSVDHFDRYHSFDDYVAAKQRIYCNAQHAVFNRDDNQTFPPTGSKQISFGLSQAQDLDWGVCQKSQQTWLCRGEDCVIATDEVKIKGKHNWLNAQAAAALAYAAGIAIDSIIAVLKEFAGLAHRCQWIRQLDEVQWYNDSKGTNIGATISAIEGIGAAMQGKIVLIAGGQGKGADFNQMHQVIDGYVRSVVLIGEDADLIETALQNRVPVLRADDMDDAVLKAKQCAMPGDVVLLSPACASFDMYSGFAQRGDVFTQAVNGL